MVLLTLSVIVFITVAFILDKIESISKETDSKLRTIIESYDTIFKDNQQLWFKLKERFDEKYNEFLNNYEKDAGKQNDFIFKTFTSVKQIEKNIESSLDKMINLVAPKDVMPLSSPSVPKVKRAYVKKAKKIEAEEVVTVNKETEKVEEKPNVNRRKKRNKTDNISVG